MDTLMSREEFARLVDVSVEQVEQWREEGLLDPQGLGGFEELDLMRWFTIREYETRGYRSDQLAVAVRRGEVNAFLAEYLFPVSPRMSVEEAASRAGISVEKIAELRGALGLVRETRPEDRLLELKAFKTMEAAGLPWDAILEGARVYRDALRRLAETEVRLVHGQVHERLSAAGVAEDDVRRQILNIQETIVPLLDAFVQAVHHEHLLQASIEDVYLHLPARSCPPSAALSRRRSCFLTLSRSPSSLRGRATRSRATC
jgi:hypothetical protein